MEQENVKSFDFAAIMRRGDMDVLKIARGNPQMTAEEYLILLSRFVAGAPAAEDAINKIAEFGYDENDLKTLADIKILLMCIGHSAILQDLNALLTDAGKSNKRLASILAQNFFDVFRGVYRRALASVNGSLEDFWEQFKEETEESEKENKEEIDGSPKTLMEALRLVIKNEARRKRRVLSVDDSMVMIKTVTSALGGEYTVQGLTDSMKIEQFLFRFMPDLFLLDVIMPGLGGFELIPIIRRFPEHKETPIIILTGNGSAECLATAVSLGVSDFMVKPIKPKVLREKIAKHTAKRPRQILL